jgi:peptide deformylase
MVQAVSMRLELFNFSCTLTPATRSSTKEAIVTTLLSISLLGNPILRQVAKPVEDITDRSIQDLIDNMIDTCEDANGFGIAAPQVYVPLRVFIVFSRPNERYPGIPNLGPIPIINPSIVSASDGVEKGWEGCLSIPGIRGLVPRHKSVQVSYTNREGKQEERIFDDFVARIFQHEYDHIDGVVFLDRTDPKELWMEKEYQRMLRDE